jgi:hypothetical protein
MSARLSQTIFRAEHRYLYFVFLLLALFLILHPSLSSADPMNELRQSSSFRCGPELVSLGITAADVMVRCGKPLRRVVLPRGGTSGQVKGESFRERRKVQKEERADSDTKARVKKTMRKSAMRETWYYDMGSSDFVYSLHFEEGILKKIERGGRGKDR